VDDRREELMHRIEELRARFMQCHVTGMDALKRGDLDALDAAIKAEAKLIDEQEQISVELRALADA